MNYLRLSKSIALMAIDNIVSQSVNTLLAAGVLMALMGAASPHVLGFLAVVMPWLFRITCFIYLGLAAFKAGWQLVNRIRAIK